MHVHANTTFEHGLVDMLDLRCTMSCLGGFHDAQLQPSFAWSSRTAKFISRSVAMSFHNCHLPRGWRNDKSFSQRTVSFKGPTARVAFLCLLVPCVLVSVCFGCISIVWHAVLRIPREISFGQTLRYADVSEQIQVSIGGEWGM